VDFRGDHKNLGKAVIKAKDFTKFDPEIQQRLEYVSESAEHPSVLRLFLDTTSRFRFYRKFKRTIRFLTNLKHDPESEYIVEENLKQHNVAGFTAPNQIAYTHGVSDDQCRQTRGMKRIDTYAKQMGYITGFTQDICQTNDYYDKWKMKDSCIDHNSPDHLFMGPACSKYNGGPGGDMTDRRLFSHAWTSASRKCFMGQPLAETNFDYVKDWFRVYAGKRKYFTYRTCMMHNVYGELAHDFDRILESFLIDLLGP
jgi:hypothetical protein